MRITPARCPTCGEPAVSILESLLADAQVSYDQAAGAFDYTDDSDVAWDTQEPLLDDNGLATVKCANFHQWQAVVAPDS